MRIADVDHPEGLARVQAFLEAISLVPTSTRTIPRRARSRLMTPCIRPGLEYPVVFLIGLEDGVFPHVRSLVIPTSSKKNAAFANVGITRAEQRLYLCPRVEPHDVRSTINRPASRFLDEIPAELVCRSATRRSAAKGSAASRFGRCGRDASPDPPPTSAVVTVAMGAHGAIRSVCASATTSPTKRFGEGVIVDIEGSGDKAEAIVRFQRRGRGSGSCSYGPRSRRV